MAGSGKCSLFFEQSNIEQGLLNSDLTSKIPAYRQAGIFEYSYNLNPNPILKTGFE